MLNGPGHLNEQRRYVGNMNLSFAYVEGESLIMGLKVRARWLAADLETFAYQLLFDMHAMS